MKAPSEMNLQEVEERLHELAVELRLPEDKETHPKDQRRLAAAEGQRA